jgi:hypothetical protein
LAIDVLPVLSSLSYLAVILGVVFVVFQLRQNANLLKVQTEELKTEARADEGQVILDITKMLGEADVLKLFIQIKQHPFTSYGELTNAQNELRVEFESAIYRIVITFEGFGILVKRGIVPLAVVDEFAHGLIREIWLTIAPFIESYRQTTGHVEIAEWLEYLFLRIHQNMADDDATKLIQSRRDARSKSGDTEKV